jgi:hypothetical protein
MNNREYTKDELTAAREARRLYLREWRTRNPEKVKAYNHKYWIRRSKKASEVKLNEKNGVAAIV